MLTIIEVEARADGGHGLQSQSHRTECWLEGWIAVPPELEERAWACRGYCTLDIQEGVLVGLTPGELSAEPEEDAPLDQRVAELESSNAELLEALNMILTGVTE